MPTKAKLYISCVLTAGFTVLAASLPQLAAISPEFATFLALTAVAAALKVRLPQMEGSISVSFVFLLFAVTEFALAQVAVMAACAAVVQSYWRPARRPTIVQVAFNAAALVISAAAAQSISQYVVQAGGIHSELVLMAVGAFLFYTIDTLLIATVLSLVQGKPLGTVWSNCHLWAFPYYLVGAILLDVVVTMDTEWRLRAPLLALPLMMLVHAFYRTLISRFTEGAEGSAATSA
jgi:hypothetical protein